METKPKSRCFYCNKILRPIKSDKDYPNWKRKYHTKCYLLLEKEKNDKELIELYKEIYHEVDQSL